ncbi:MAG: hypothetical protein C0594_00810, partial [Marinilabiliales bacterium]
NDPDRKFELNIKNILFAGLEISRKIVSLGGGQEANWQDLYVSTDKKLDMAKKRLKEQMEEIEEQQATIDEKSKILAEQEESIESQKDSLNKQQENMIKNKKILNMHQEAIKNQESKISNQQQVLDKQMSELKKQRLILYLFGTLFFVILGLAYFIYRSYKIKKKANKLLEEKNHEITIINQEITQQKEEIEVQKDELIFKNREIEQQKEEIQAQAEHLEEMNHVLGRTNDLLTSSINYAKKIQDAILPGTNLMYNYIKDFFIYFKPKDIVSGDFYWMKPKGNSLLIAAVDCTGHGVPGALMSMIGNTLLNDIVKDPKVKTPAEMLNKMNEGIIQTLDKENDDEDSQDDGMDVSLCEIDKSGKITLSLANHMAYYIEDKKLDIIEGDIFSIGDPLAKIKEVKFSNHELEPKENSTLYMFSDGYQDQFGGENNQKFMAGKMQKLLISSQHLSMNDQKALLDEEFKLWKGTNRQLDDILVIGLKF